MNNPLFVVFTSIVSIVGFPTAIILYFKGKKKLQITYYLKSLEIAKTDVKPDSKLELFFGGQKVFNVRVTKIAIWNSGNHVINATDIAETEKLRIESVCDSRILEAKVVAECEKSDGFRTIQEDETKCSIDFDYIGVNEGVTIQIVHTGERSGINVKGKIKGGEPLGEYEKNSKFFIRNEKKARRVVDYMMVILPVIPILLMTIDWLIYFGIISDDVLNNWGSRMCSLVILSVISIAYLLLEFIVLKKVFKIGVPKPLKDSIEIEY